MGFTKSSGCGEQVKIMWPEQDMESHYWTFSIQQNNKTEI